MKKFYSILLLFAMLAALFAGCGSKDNTNTTPSEPEYLKTTTAATEAVSAEVPETTAPTEFQLVIPNISPNVVGLYIPAEDGTKNRTLVTEFSGPREPKTDIDCFEVFASNTELIEGSSFTAMWQEVWNSYEDTANAQIGFSIQLRLKNGETISKTLLKPSDSDEFFDYLEIYLYDDIHQSGWYTHLSDSDMKEGTIISSIKLHCGSRIDEVGDIILTAFIYNGDDCFDADGDYIGQVSATIVITE